MAALEEPFASRELPFQAEWPMMRCCPIINSAQTLAELLQLVDFGHVAPAFTQRGWTSVEFLWAASGYGDDADELFSPAEEACLERMRAGLYTWPQLCREVGVAQEQIPAFDIGIEGLWSMREEHW